MNSMMLLNRDFLLNGPHPAVPCGFGEGFITWALME